MRAAMEWMRCRRRGGWLWTVVIWAMAMTAGTDLLLAQISADEQARRLLEDGRAALREGKLKQALDNLNTIVTGFANTNVVDDALLEIGRAYLIVGKDVEKARAAFDEVTKRYPQENAAPGAYYHMGWLALQKASTRTQHEEALAQFTRLYRLYPKSEWVPQALFAAGLTLRRAGRFAEAIQIQRRVFFEHPRDDVAPAALFEVGHTLALMGRSELAMEEYQRLRNSYAGSEWAQRALDRNTALWRLHGRQPPAYVIDPDFSLDAGHVTQGVRGVLVTSDGALWIASQKGNLAACFIDGRLSNTLSMMNPRSLSLTPTGELIIAAENAVRVGPKAVRGFSILDERGIAKPLDRIAAALVTVDDEWLVSDLRHNAIFRFNQEGQLLGRFGDDKAREVRRLLLDGEGAVVALDREARVIEVFDQSGQLQRRIALKSEGLELRRAMDVAVDPERNIYIVDEQKGIVILSPDGRLITTVGQETLLRPQAVTLSADGSILVYDDKQEKIVRFY